jgi:hypothetical protein
VLDAMVEVAAYILRSLSDAETRGLTLSLVPVLEKVSFDRHERFSLPKWQAVRAGLKRHQAIAELNHLEAAGFIRRCPGDIVRYTPIWRAVKAVSAPPEPVFPQMTCIRALEAIDKATVLELASNQPHAPQHFTCNPGSFEALPGHTFAYWASDKIRELFIRMPLFKDAPDRLACVTNPAGDDTRYFRCFWEPPAEQFGPTKQWALLAKGGEFSRYYADQHLVVSWDKNLGSYKGFLGTPHRPLIRPASVDHFFRPGLTYSRRSQKGFSVRVLPADTIFHDKGPGIFTPEHELLPFLAVLNSVVYSGLLGLQMAFGSYEIGVVQKTPMPDSFGEFAIPLGIRAHRAWAEKRSIDVSQETSHAFLLPSLLTELDESLAERSTSWSARVRSSEQAVDTIQPEIDDLAFRLYGLDEADHAALTAACGTEPSSEAEIGEGEEEETATTAPAFTADLLSYTIGTALGRWDIRFATGEKPAPELPDPFTPLPVCPPGQLQSEQGLPITKEEVTQLKEEGRWNYPIEIPWDGILVDDPGYPLDLEDRIRQVLQVIWKDTWEAIERETCEILDVRSLRDYFARPNNFFAYHLKRYSKSRRQAPIYWPLQTPSGSYTVWLYYHRLTDQTLYTCVNDVVDPKLTQTTEQLNALRTKTGRSTQEEKQLEGLMDFEQDLTDFRDELLHVARFWKPNLNDGVQITAAPLWKLFQHKPWQKKLKDTWTKLEKGDYDWAHLAYSIWPDRVREKCKHDKSLAIAHGLEDLYEEQPEQPSKKRSRKRG